MLAHGDRLPECHIPSDQNDSVVFCQTPEPNGTKKWTGWTWLTPSNYATLPGNMDEATLSKFILTTMDTARKVDVSRLLSTQSFSQLLTSNQQVLSGDFPVKAVTKILG